MGFVKNMQFEKSSELKKCKIWKNSTWILKMFLNLRKVWDFEKRSRVRKNFHGFEKAHWFGKSSRIPKFVEKIHWFGKRLWIWKKLMNSKKNLQNWKHFTNLKKNGGFEKKSIDSSSRIQKILNFNKCSWIEKVYRFGKYSQIEKRSWIWKLFMTAKKYHKIERKGSLKLKWKNKWKSKKENPEGNWKNRLEIRLHHVARESSVNEASECAYTLWPLYLAYSKMVGSLAEASK